MSSVEGVCVLLSVTAEVRKNVLHNVNRESNGGAEDSPSGAALSGRTFFPMLIESNKFNLI